VNDKASNCCKVRGDTMTVRGPTFVLFFCKLMVTDPTFSSSVRSASENPTVSCPCPVTGGGGVVGVCVYMCL